MIKQHLRYNIPDDINAKLWRYLELSKLEILLKSKTLYFCRSDLFEDQHEGTYTKNALEYRKYFYAEASDNWLNNTMPHINLNWKKCTFISCWHVNNNEDVNMWRAYSKEGKLIVIESTILKLKNSISDIESTFLLGLINYIDYQTDLISEANAFAPFFNKRKEFSGEREFRIIKERVVDIDNVIAGKITMPTGVNISIVPELLIKKIIISPFADANYSKKVIKVLKKYDILKKLERSALKTSPIY